MSIERSTEGAEVSPDCREHIRGDREDVHRWLPFLLQTADALFPTGAYAHSLGFEEVVRLEVVHDERTLRDFLLQQIAPAQREQELPYLRFAFEAAAAHDLNALCAIDREIGAWKLARESRQASAQLGVRRLKTLRSLSDRGLILDWSECVASGRAAGHHIVTCGVQAIVQRVPLGAALAAVCGAALKLIRIGQEGCQRVLREAMQLAESMIGGSLSISRASAGWFNPVLEIASMRHEHAEERLFIS